MIISNNLKMYAQKLRSSNLRPTKQRLKICQFLFDRKKTFHFTVETLNKKINKNFKEFLNNLKGQVLHAYHLEFNHPRSNKKMEFNSKLPKEFDKMIKFLEKQKN